MPVPKYRTSKSKRDMRRSHHAIATSNGSTCPNCGAIKRPHAVCASCGFYKGKQVMQASSADLSFDDSSFDTSGA